MKECILIWYPKCSTCKEAKKYLEGKGLTVMTRNIVEECLTESEIKMLLEQKKCDIKKFFNTSGLVYKRMNLKEKLNSMSEEEKITLLASNGMLVKRPLILFSDSVVLGYKKDEIDKIIGGN